MSELQWCDPPEAVHAANRKPRWEFRLRPLRESPMRWALVGEYKTDSTARHIVYRLRHLSQMQGTWEFTHAPIQGKKGRYGVWARFMGRD